MADNKPLKVVHIISGDRWAGAEAQAYTLLKELDRHCDVHVILMNDGELADRLRTSGLKVSVIDEAKYNSFKILGLLISRLRRLQPHIVHTHRQKENILGSIANFVGARAISLRTVHGAPEFTASGRQKVQVLADRYCGKYLQKAVIAVSDELAAQLGALFPRRSIHTILNGIDPDAVRSGLTCPDFKQCHPDDRHIGIVGRVEPVKRPDIFLQMAKLLLQDAPQTSWRFHVFGDGSLLAAMKQMSHDLHIDAQVTFHGHRQDIRSCIDALDAVVMPSDHEGLPMTALEAVALGTPFFCHKVGGLTDLLARYPQYLIAENRPARYAEALRFTLDGQAAVQSSPQTLDADYLASTNGAKVSALYHQLTGRTA
ncbi:glycosyltransferase [Exilibacterium tricleocarpae]|uniref:Glycosyltransferase n=1 Tax=Exilibacterium tricleocarpae TaxID=2591008 RepID=A0A545T3G3_9GAMM|nr:glycosyltransferase [Exilibacterium tricleocarpae]TQV71746.1 glycosyltransferase [Exilibacterium tricleocarpae]